MKMLLLAGALAGAAASAPALAAGAPETREIVIAYDRDDLADPQAVADLETRIHHAAEAICGGDRFSRDLRLRHRVGRCVQEVEAEAAAELHARVAVYHEESGRMQLAAPKP